jgi:hypothetical protein
MQMTKHLTREVSRTFVMNSKQFWKAPEVAPKYFGEIAALHSRSLRQRVERSGGPI